MEKNKKHSINRKISKLFIGLMAATLLLLWLLNNLFLEKYYIQDKQKILINAYEILDRATVNDTIMSEEFDIELSKLNARYNLNVLVVDVDSKTIKSVGYDAEKSRAQLWNNLFLPTDENIKYIVNEERYKMQITQDVKTKGESIEIWGMLDNGNLFLIHTPLESIQDSVDIANRFLAYVGLAMVLISGVIIWGMTKKITEPILELTKLSEKMAKLDFDVKYQGDSQNEIGILGENFNSMSQALEQTIAELKTANNELQKDIQQKNQIDEMRKEFLSNVSHELKTPIALIQGYAEGLLEGINDDEESRNFYSSVIVDEAQKMNVMVRKLLTLNQLEFGTDAVVMERFDIVELVKGYLSSSEIVTKQNDCRLQVENSAPIFVWGDEFKVEEIVMNYFTNAINHLEGDRVIDIKFEHKENGKVRITVFNTGNPIPDENIEHIWEKFYKVDKARTREYGGSGIGLSIVKAIMDSMNQKYGVDNYENGVAFWFELEICGESGNFQSMDE